MLRAIEESFVLGLQTFFLFFFLLPEFLPPEWNERRVFG